MTVFTFRIFYAIDGDYQERYVVAETEAEAFEKITAHFEKQHKEGLAMPVYITDPVVEVDNVII